MNAINEVMNSLTHYTRINTTSAVQEIPTEKGNGPAFPLGERRVKFRSRSLLDGLIFTERRQRTARQSTSGIALLITAVAQLTFITGLAQSHTCHDTLVNYRGCRAIIAEDIQAQNDRDTTTFLSLRTDTCGAQNRNVFRTLWRQKPRSNFMLDLISAKLVDLKRIPLNVARNFFQLETLTKCYHQLACFYVAIDYHLKRETTYMYDGTNYRLYILGLHKDRWFILEASQAPIESLRKQGYGFGTEQEKAAEKMQLLKERTGKSFDLQGKQILPENTNDKRSSK